LESVQACARAFVEKEDRLDLVVCNAGIMAVPEGVTKEGYEVQFGTNHVGHALLVKLLLPVLQRTVEIPGADVRVVTVSSVGHHLAPAEGVEFAALKGGMGHLTTWNRYAQSKLANRLYAKQLAERYPGIMSVSVHPGVVTTNLYTAVVGDVGLKKMAYWGFKTALSVSVEQGSKNQLWAATSPRDGLVPGEYYFPVGILGKGSKQGEDEELGKKLWEWTEKELEGYTL
jgi:NAD(P)-dependent dehydrogenase (short-subunit alcohol dehydrogenase family)